MPSTDSKPRRPPIPISAYFSLQNPHALYTYDFGDGWEHSVTLEAILPQEPGLDYPRCLGGERACPPEDCGGTYGYAEFLAAIRDPEHEEHQSMLEWVGGAFDPEHFRPEAVQFDDPGERWRVALAGQVDLVLSEGALLTPDQGVAHPFVKWMQQDAGDHVARAEPLPLRRDMVTVLTYVRDHRVTGTQSTGNFPLKVVREVTAQFVHPPKLEETIGDRTFRVRSEDAVWPLSFPHALPSVGGLLEGGPARRWRLTPVGEKFLGRHAPRRGGPGCGSQP